MNTSLMHHIEIEGRPVRITLTDAARTALDQRSAPLIAEMELYFSCLIRKQVRFREQAQGTADVVVDDHLSVRFRPVMTRTCGNDYEGDEPPLTEFPIANSRPYVPHWLQLDFKHGHWQGEFGYDAAR
jgi:hypothetical protein